MESAAKCMMSRRLMTAKAPNRAAVHGTKLPVTGTINREEAEKEIDKAKQEKEKKREEVEKVVDSQLSKQKKEKKREEVEKVVDSQLSDSDKPYSTIK